MSSFVNEYKYTPDMAGEAIRAYMRNKADRDYKMMLLLIPLAIVCTFLTRKITILLIVVGLELVLVIGLMKLAAYRTIKAEKERMQVLYPEGPPVIRFEIGKSIIFNNGKQESNVAFSDIVKILETKNLIVIILKGEMNIALGKTNFLEGSPEECLSYLETSTGIKAITYSK